MKTYRILSDDELREARICEEYSCLVGPDGFECVLGEPEDRVWWRDLSPVVERLNNYADRIAELEAALTAAQERTMAIRIIFDGPPGPDAGQFVEVETDTGESISIGEWIDRKDGYWALRIAKLPAPPEQED